MKYILTIIIIIFLSLNLWSQDNNKAKITLVKGHLGKIISIDSNYSIIATADSKTVKLWDAEKYYLIKSIPQVTGYVQSVIILDFSYIIAIHTNRECIFYDYRKDIPLHIHKSQNEILSFAVSKFKDYYAIKEFNSIEIWKEDGGR